MYKYWELDISVDLEVILGLFLSIIKSASNVSKSKALIMVVFEILAI